MIRPVYRIVIELDYLPEGVSSNDIYQILKKEIPKEILVGLQRVKVSVVDASVVKYRYVKS